MDTAYSDMDLPPCEQRHIFLRYEGLEYSDTDIADFEARLARIHRREVHRVSVFDFEGLPNLMAEGLSARMLMEHRNNQGMGISSAGDFLGTAPSYTAIQDPILRLCHLLIACSIAGRSQAPEKVTVMDLFYLRGMDIGSVNVPYLLARYLRLRAAGRKSGAHISSGQFVARLAVHFGLLTVEILRGLTFITPELLMIDMAEEATRCYGWCPVVAEDALAIDEGDQTVLAPVQAPQQPPPPPPAPARFSTWAITGLGRMMDRAGVTYTLYSQTHVPYQRRIKRKTDEASTSTTQTKPGSKFNTIVHRYDTKPCRIFTQQMQERERDDFEIKGS
ncbi:hypothetical protein Tco_0852141 [Tanacetum coccineum]